MKTVVQQNRPRRRGIAIITTTLALFTIIPMVGLAIDLISGNWRVHDDELKVELKAVTSN